LNQNKSGFTLTEFQSDAPPPAKKASTTRECYSADPQDHI